MRAAGTAAIMYSLVSTCKRHGIEPWAYFLRDALARLPELPPEQLDQLLPDVWANSHKQILKPRQSDP